MGADRAQEERPTCSSPPSGSRRAATAAGSVLSQGERGRALIARALWPSRRCCCSTSRRPGSTSPPASTCSTPSTGCGREHPELGGHRHAPPRGPAGEHHPRDAAARRAAVGGAPRTRCSRRRRCRRPSTTRSAIDRRRGALGSTARLRRTARSRRGGGEAGRTAALRRACWCLNAPLEGVRRPVCRQKDPMPDDGVRPAPQRGGTPSRPRRRPTPCPTRSRNSGQQSPTSSNPANSQGRKKARPAAAAAQPAAAGAPYVLPPKQSRGKRDPHLTARRRRPRAVVPTLESARCSPPRSNDQCRRGFL